MLLGFAGRKLRRLRSFAQSNDQPRTQRSSATETAVQSNGPVPASREYGRGALGRDLFKQGFFDRPKSLLKPSDGVSKIVSAG